MYDVVRVWNSRYLYIYYKNKPQSVTFFLLLLCVWLFLYLCAVGIDTWTKHRTFAFYTYVDPYVGAGINVRLQKKPTKFRNPRNMKYLIDHGDVLRLYLYVYMLSSINLMKVIFSCVSRRHRLFRCVLGEHRTLLYKCFFFRLFSIIEDQSDIHWWSMAHNFIYI